MASRIAMAPRSEALREESPPRNFPIGVRAAPTMKTSGVVLMVISLVTGGRGSSGSVAAPGKSASLHHARAGRNGAGESSSEVALAREGVYPRRLSAPTSPLRSRTDDPASWSPLAGFRLPGLPRPPGDGPGAGDR